MYTINLSLTEEDYLDYYIHYYKDSGSLWKMRITLSIAIFYFSIFFVKTTETFGIARKLFLATILTVSLIYFLPVLFYNQNKRQTKELLKQDKNGNLMSAKIITIDQSGIKSTSEHAQTQYDWDLIIKVRIVREVIYLYISPNQAIILPIRFFENIKDEIINLIKDKVEDIQKI